MLSFLKSLGIIEICLMQAVFYCLLWLSNTYLATLFTFILVPIFASLLIISLIAELLDRSKVPKWYFKFMFLSVIIPLIVAMFFYNANDGFFDWMQ
ncbi:MAG: hypothetical protein P1U56_14380 [Saprospiraceae bacterium]|nr:hypothetical protein [Saprospiraceae bacterium]